MLKSKNVSQVAKGSIADKMFEIWTTDISKEEAKSCKLWEKKASFLEENAKTYGKEPVKTKPKQRMRHNPPLRKGI